MKNLNDNLKKLKNPILILVCLMLLVPLIWISIYTRPASDDYSYSKFLIDVVRDENHTVFDLIKASFEVGSIAYNYFDGTFISHPIKALQPGIYGEQYYFIGAIGLFVFIFITLYPALKNLHKLFNYTNNILLETLFIMGVLLAGMPGINQGIYWFNGAWNYTPFYFLTIFNVTLLVKYIFGESLNRKDSIIQIILATIYAFICSGGNYIVSFLNVLVLFVIMAVAFYKKKFQLAFPFVAGMASFCIEFFAPGRAGKQVTESIGIFSTIKLSLLATKNCFAEWTNVQWIALMLVLIIIGFALKDNIKAKINPICFLVLSVMLIFALYCMPYYANGSVGPSRVVNIIWMTFIILSGMNCIYITVWLIQKYDIKVEEKIPEPVRIIGAILLILACTYFNGSNIKIAQSELDNGIAKQYASECDSRYEAMRNANIGDELETKPLTVSEIVYRTDLTADENNWKNNAWREYYGIGMHIVEE